jgi:hypothetical protein
VLVAVAKVDRKAHKLGRPQGASLLAMYRRIRAYAVQASAADNDCVETPGLSGPRVQACMEACRGLADDITKFRPTQLSVASLQASLLGVLQAERAAAQAAAVAAEVEREAAGAQDLARAEGGGCAPRWLDTSDVKGGVHELHSFPELLLLTAWDAAYGRGVTRDRAVPRGEDGGFYPAPPGWCWARRAEVEWGFIRLSLFSTAQPLYTRLPIILSTCFSKVTIGHHHP